MTKIYIVTQGDIDDDDHFQSAHATRQGAINYCVGAARKMVDDMSGDPDAKWTSTSDLEKYTAVKRLLLNNRFPATHMSWWDIEEVELQE